MCRRLVTRRRKIICRIHFDACRSTSVCTEVVDFLDCTKLSPNNLRVLQFIGFYRVLSKITQFSQLKWTEHPYEHPDLSGASRTNFANKLSLLWKIMLEGNYFLWFRTCQKSFFGPMKTFHVSNFPFHFLNMFFINFACQRTQNFHAFTSEMRKVETYFFHSLKRKFSHIYSWGRPTKITPFVYEGKYDSRKKWTTAT